RMPKFVYEDTFDIVAIVVNIDWRHILSSGGDLVWPLRSNACHIENHVAGERVFEERPWGSNSDCRSVLEPLAGDGLERADANVWSRRPRASHGKTRICHRSDEPDVGSRGPRVESVLYRGVESACAIIRID